MGHFSLFNVGLDKEKKRSYEHFLFVLVWLYVLYLYFGKKNRKRAKFGEYSHLSA